MFAGALDVEGTFTAFEFVSTIGAVQSPLSLGAGFAGVPAPNLGERKMRMQHR